MEAWFLLRITIMNLNRTIIINIINQILFHIQWWHFNLMIGMIVIQKLTKFLLMQIMSLMSRLRGKANLIWIYSRPLWIIKNFRIGLGVWLNLLVVILLNNNSRNRRWKEDKLKIFLNSKLLNHQKWICNQKQILKVIVKEIL